MQMAMYLVNAVLVEGQSVRTVARDHGVSKTWVYELLARYDEEGEAGLEARSRRPLHSPTKITDRFEEEIVALRKELEAAGFDAGPETIAVHLRRAHRRGQVPSISTIWRVLSARGFIVAQPHKRPKSSWIRFEADLPNECWQMDITHWCLASGQEVEILDIVDDHSRLCIASRALAIYKAIDVVATFHQAAGQWGYPASMLSDNGAVFTAAARHGVCVMESELMDLGIKFKHSSPRAPSDLRQGRALPPDPQEIPRGSAPGPFPRRPPASARPVRALLQRGAPPSLTGPAHPTEGLRGPHQSTARQATLQGPAALPGTPGQGERRQRDAALQEPALPHRGGSQVQRAQGADPGQGPRRADLDPRRRGPQAPHAGPEAHLPAPRGLKIVHDVSRDLSTMSRDITT
jgi:transposase InsO family protein